MSASLHRTSDMRTGSSSAASDRFSSRVVREMRAGGAVYVKQYTEGPWGRTAKVVQERAARELDLINRLSASGALGGRLGLPLIVECDVEAARLVTAEISGRPLEECLRPKGSSQVRKGNVRAMFLAGRWLQRFQQLQVRAGDEVQISDRDPIDLTEYCDFRIEAIREARGWPDARIRDGLLAGIRKLVSAASEEDRRLVWSHGDYAPGNLIWDGRMLTVIDFATARSMFPLLDVTHFVHRLEMLRVYRPWEAWPPLAVWRRAFLRGYGRPDAEASPMWQALMIRHLLCRLTTYALRPPRDAKQALHDRYVRWWLRRRLCRAAQAAGQA